MRLLPFLLAILFAASLIATGSFGGFDPSAFPIPQTDPPVQPEGWAFSIWGVIYIGLIAHGVRSRARGDHPDWAGTRWPLVISLGVGIFWISVAKVSPIWATALILVMLGGAVLAYLRAGRAEPWFLGWPLGLYAGWLTAASAVSLGILAAGWGLTGALPAALAGIVTTAAVGLAVTFTRPGSAFTAALVWGLAGIAAANWGTEPAVTWTALIGAAVLIAALAVRRPKAA